MIPWVQLDTGSVPGEQDALRLMQRGDEFSIRVGTVELMNNRRSGSEEALATRTCARLRDRPQARILIGGLGMGFTLRAALDGLGSVGREGCRRGSRTSRGHMGPRPTRASIQRKPGRPACGATRRRRESGHSVWAGAIRCHPARRRQWTGRTHAAGQQPPL